MMPSGEPSVTDQATAEPYLSLYRRFRPAKLSELRGQPHVVQALRGAVAEGRVAHAYLFSGPRGTGKTSAARVLAKALNCAAPTDGEPCGVCDSCVAIAAGTSMDVRELDAASNNGVDAMRDLVSHAALATPGKWKLYIVDEVHMLSAAAANALLKTLEEPPSHVVFVLATTDPQKVPQTVRSRTQHYEFRLLGADTLGELLSVGSGPGRARPRRRGAGAGRAAGSGLGPRRAIGARPDGLVGLAPTATGPSWPSCSTRCATRTPAGCSSSVASLVETGFGPPQLASELVDDLRQAFLLALAPELASASGSERDRLAAQAERFGLARLVRTMEALGLAQVDMREAPDARVVLEVTLVRLARPAISTVPPTRWPSDSRGSSRPWRLGQSMLRRDRQPGPDNGLRPEPGRAARCPKTPVTRPGIGALRRQRAEQTARTRARRVLPTETSVPATEAPAAGQVAPVETTVGGRVPDRDDPGRSLGRPACFVCFPPGPRRSTARAVSPRSRDRRRCFALPAMRLPTPMRGGPARWWSEALSDALRRFRVGLRLRRRRTGGRRSGTPRPLRCPGDGRRPDRSRRR